MERYGDVDHQMKKVKVAGLHLVVKKNQVDAIVSQIDAMQRMKDVYVKIMGQEKYDKKIVALMNQMPGMDRSADHFVSAIQVIASKSRYINAWVANCYNSFSVLMYKLNRVEY